MQLQQYQPIAQPASVPAPRVTALMTLSLALVSGIGGTYTFSEHGAPSSTTCISISPIVMEKRGSKAYAENLSYEGPLRKIRDAFRLNMTDLALALGVSRTALYSWFGGTVPHSKQVERIVQLQSFAEKVSLLKIERIDLLSRIPLSTGRTLLQTLLTNENVLPAISEVSTLSTRRVASMRDRENRTGRKEKILGAVDLSPSFSDFE